MKRNYVSCPGCGRLFRDDGTEDQMMLEHDCNEVEEDECCECGEVGHGCNDCPTFMEEEQDQ